MVGFFLQATACKTARATPGSPQATRWHLPEHDLRLLRTGELASVVIGCLRFISPAVIAELVARSTTTISPSLASARSHLTAQGVLPLPLPPSRRSRTVRARN